MLKNKKLARAASCLLAVFLSVTAIVGSFTMLASAAWGETYTITYWSGDKTNSGASGNKISEQKRDTGLSRKDTLKNASEVVKDSTEDGVADVTNFQNDGYLLTGWKIGNKIYAVGADAYSLTNTNQNLTAIAQWGKKSDIIINGTSASAQETSVDNDNGKIKLSSHPAVQGKDLTITLTPSEGFELDTFEVDDVDVKSAVSKGAYTIPAASVDDSVKITTSFKKQTFKLNITADEHAEVTPAPGEYTVEYGANQEITILAEEKYEISSVKVDGKSKTLSDNKLTLSNIKADTNVAITTKEKTYEVTAEVTGIVFKHGTVSPVKQNVKEGEDFVLTLNPEDGYQVDKLMLDDEDVTDGIVDNTYTLTNVTAKHSFVVTYGTLVTHQVSVSASEGVIVDITDNPFTVKDREKKEIGVDVSEGYRLTSIEINDKKISDIKLGIVALTKKLDISGAINTSLIDPGIREDINIKITAEKNISSYIINASVKLEDLLFGTVEPMGLKSVEEGSDYTLTIKPAENYELDVLTLDGEDVTAEVVNNTYTLTNVDAGHSFVASFRKSNYNVVTEVLPDLTGDHGSITASSSVKYGESFTINMDPDEHYELDYLTVNAKRVDVVDNTYTIENITSDMLVVAKFKKKLEYNFTIQAPEFVKTIPVAGTERVGYGDLKTIVINPDEGYKITKVTVNGESRSIDEDGGILIVSNITSDTVVEIKAKMKTFIIGAISTDILRGTVKPLLDIVDYGEDYVLNISPNNGFELEKLTLDGNEVTSQVKDNTFTIKGVKASHALIASFKKKTFTVTIDAPEGVTTDPSGPTLSVEYLDTKNIKITPDEAHYLASVKVNGTEVLPLVIIDNNLTLLAIGEDKDIVIEAKKRQYDIYTEVFGGHGSITEDGVVEYGSDFTVNLYPDTGYRLAFLTVDGKDVTAEVVNNSYTIPEIKSTTRVRAAYQKIEYPITTEVVGEGGKISKSGTAKYGENYRIKVTAYNDYIVDSFKVDGEPAELIGDTYIFSNVTAEHTASVSFKHVPRSLNISSADGATITPTGSMEVEYGESKDIEIKANRNYELESVKVNGEEQPLPLENDILHLENITKSLTVEVITKKVAHDIATSVDGEHGTISEGGNVADKSSFTVTATPDAGYKLETLTVNDEIVKTENNSYTIESVEQDTTIVAAFSEYYPSITHSQTLGANILSGIPTQVTYGSDLEVKIIATAGFYLSSIKVNGIEQPLPLEDDTLVISNITEDTTIEVSAEAKIYHMVAGAHQAVDADSDKNVIFVSDGDCNEFVKFDIDGQEVDSTHYVKTCGSTIIEVDREYIASLAPGEHTARFEYSNGTVVDTDFVIEDSTHPTAPNTGEHSTPTDKISTGISLTTIVAVLVAAFIWIFTKRRRRS